MLFRSGRDALAVASTFPDATFRRVTRKPIQARALVFPRIARIVVAGVARIVAAASAARIGLTMDKLDDLALAIDEACGSLLTTGTLSALECSVGADAESIHVRVAALDAPAEGWPPADWGETLEGIVLSGATTSAAPLVDDGVPAIRFSISA